jgi:hypothetical protein
MEQEKSKLTPSAMGNRLAMSSGPRADPSLIGLCLDQGRKGVVRSSP